MIPQSLRTRLAFGGVVVAAVAVLAGFGLGRITGAPSPPVGASNGRPVLYWYDPMVPSQHFDKPGKSPFMDMQLVPKYADEAPGAAGVAIDPASVQSLGVHYATASRAALGEAVSAAGIVGFNERQVAVVQARSGGFVQRTYGRAPGDVIGAGAPLADVLVPEWAGAQAEFLAVRRTGDAPLIAAARQRLALLGMPASLISQIERAGRQRTVITITTPLAGVIRTLTVRPGMTLAAGQTLAEVNGLGTVWVTASVPAQRAGALRLGQSAKVVIAGDTARPLYGPVSAILPQVEGESRTLQVRIELANPDGRLHPGAFATVTFEGVARPTLVVPSEAVIRTGRRSLVMLALPGGRFQPAEVQVGQESGGRTEILSGLAEGERIVASGQFLIDSEASLSGVRARVAAPAAPDVSPALHETRGRVERIDGAMVTLSHEPVPAIGWPAMTMAFRLGDPALARDLKVGDRVRFAFDQPAQGPTIRRIVKEAGR